MKKNVISIALFLTVIIILSSCGTAKEAKSVSKTLTAAPPTAIPATPTLVITDTPVPPTATNTATVTPTETVTTTPTVIPAVNQTLSFYVEFQQYSRIILEFNVQTGAYYGIGTKPDGTQIDFTCVWYMLPSTDIACSGPAIPVMSSIDFKLYSAATGEEVYRNTFTYRGRVPTPTGMACEVEPQWNGYIDAHQLNMGCFALTCFQNGEVFYGNNNTCKVPWPYDWDFYHPLHPPRQ